MIYKTSAVQEAGGISFSGEIPEFELIARQLLSPLVQLNKPVRGEFEISIGSKEYLLLGEVAGSFHLVCSRCSDSFEGRFRQELEETYPLTADEIDAGEQIRQAVVLSLPDKPLCRPDCKGLCPNCGINRNTGSCTCQIQGPKPFAKLKDIL